MENIIDNITYKENKNENDNEHIMNIEEIYENNDNEKFRY